MKKRIYAILMALLLSTVTLAGCGDSGSSRSSRDRYEDDEEKDDKDDRPSSKSSNSSRKDYENDVDALIRMCEDLYEVFNDAYDYDDVADGMTDVVKALKLKTSEGTKIKSYMQDMVKIWEEAAKAYNRGREDKFDDLEDELEDLLYDFEDVFYDFLEAAYDKGADEDDLEYLEDIFVDVVLN